MSERMIETTGDSIEEAIAAGLKELGVAASDVIVEVIDEPSRGVLGIGARPARVQLKTFRPIAPPPKAPKAPEVVATPVAPAAAKPVNLDEVAEEDDDQVAISFMDDDVRDVDEADYAPDARVGKQALLELLERMEIEKAEVIVRRAGPADEQDSSPWILDISGPDLRPLIGRKGETLAALQYVTRLITSREIEHRANIVVDAAGYKAKRSKMLRDLALRMADQAVRGRRTVVLEPMPPYERRIIHLTLRHRADVQTKSVGEGPGRKVTIVPKQNN